jgi:hypothetical protein
MVHHLNGIGYVARSASSIEEAMLLVETNAVDTLVLHVSSFPTALLSELGRTIAHARRQVALIASVSVVAVAESDRRGHGELRPFRRSTWWLPFSHASEFTAGLRWHPLN